MLSNACPTLAHGTSTTDLAYWWSRVFAYGWKRSLTPSMPQKEAGNIRRTAWLDSLTMSVWLAVYFLLTSSACYGRFPRRVSLNYHPHRTIMNRLRLSSTRCTALFVSTSQSCMDVVQQQGFYRPYDAPCSCT